MNSGHALIIVLVALPPVLLYLRRRHHLSGGHLHAIGVFAIYLLGVARYTIFPLRFDPEYRAFTQQVGMAGSISIVPFFLTGGDVMTADQVIGNVLLGMPFGFGLPFVWPASPRRVLLVGLLFSVAIEGSQAILNVLGVAFPPRSADINDVILNTLGVGFGLGTFLVVRNVYRSIFAAVSGDVGPWSHFHRVLIART